MIIYIIVAVVAIAICLWGCISIFINRRSGHTVDADSSSVLTVGIFRAVSASLEVVCNSLDRISSGDKADACRNHRKSAALLDIIRRGCIPATETTPSEDRRGDFYLRYMIDASEMVAATVRSIVTRPGVLLSIADRCEIKTLREEFGALLSMASYDDGVSREFMDRCDLVYELTGDIIDMKTREMMPGDFNDSSAPYLCMKLMCDLRLFVRSLRKVLQPSGTCPSSSVSSPRP